MDPACGCSHHLLYIALKLQLTRFFARSGVCPDIGILVLCTLWPTYIVDLMLCFYAYNV